MALVFEDRDVIASRVGLHAFIVGVSRYKHLPDGGGPPATDSYGLKQLTSTARSAYRVFQWLVDRQRQLPSKLATVHMLLSPSDSERQIEPALAAFTDPAERVRFAAEAKEWKRHAGTSDDGMSFFYFAGHGLERETGDGVALCADFGDPAEGPLHNAVDIDHLLAGMAPPERVTQKIARRQIYIIDACRTRPPGFSIFRRHNVPDLWSVELGGIDNRQSALFSAAIPGTEAMALDLEQTLFSRALISCLDRDAVRPLAELDANGDPIYGVTVFTLDEALRSALAELNQKHHTHQLHSLAGRVSNFPLHYIAGRPDVEVVVEIDPADAVPYVQFEVNDADDADIWEPSNTGPYPYRKKLQAGFYRFRATVLDPQQPFQNYSAFGQVNAPRHSVKARVRS